MPHWMKEVVLSGGSDNTAKPDDNIINCYYEINTSS